MQKGWGFPTVNPFHPHNRSSFWIQKQKENIGAIIENHFFHGSVCVCKHMWSLLLSKIKTPRPFYETELLKLYN